MAQTSGAHQVTTGTMTDNAEDIAGMFEQQLNDVEKSIAGLEEEIRLKNEQLALYLQRRHSLLHILEEIGKLADADIVSMSGAAGDPAPNSRHLMEASPANVTSTTTVPTTENADLMATQKPPEHAVPYRQPEPTAEEIKRERLARKHRAETEHGQAVQRALRATQEPRKKEGYIRNLIVDELKKAAQTGTPLTRDEIVERIQAKTQAVINPGSVRTTLYALKRKNMVENHQGKWRSLM